MSLEAQINLSAVVHETASTTPSDTIRVTNVAESMPFTDGTGADKAQVCWSVSGTVGTTSIDYNLTQLRDDRGTVNISYAKMLYVKNDSADNDVHLGGLAGVTASILFPGAVAYPVRPGGVLVSAVASSGYTMTSTANIGRVRTTAGTAAFTMTVIGEGTLTTP